MGLRRREYLDAIGIDLWVPRGKSVAVAAAPGSATAQAPSEAQAPALWEALRQEVLSCTRCPLHATRTQGVLGVGPKRADWLVIGPAPVNGDRPGPAAGG